MLQQRCPSLIHLLNELFDEFVDFLRLMLLHKVGGPLHQLQLVVLHPVPRVLGSLHREGHVSSAEDMQRADLTVMISNTWLQDVHCTYLDHPPAAGPHQLLVPIVHGAAVVVNGAVPGRVVPKHISYKE